MKASTLKTLEKKGFKRKDEGVSYSRWIHPDKPNCHLEYDSVFNTWTAWHTCTHCGRTGGTSRSRLRLRDVLHDFNELPFVYLHPA